MCKALFQVAQGCCRSVFCFFEKLGLQEIVFSHSLVVDTTVRHTGIDIECPRPVPCCFNGVQNGDRRWIFTFVEQSSRPLKICLLRNHGSCNGEQTPQHY